METSQKKLQPQSSLEERHCGPEQTLSQYMSTQSFPQGLRFYLMYHLTCMWPKFRTGRALKNLAVFRANSDTLQHSKSSPVAKGSNILTNSLWIWILYFPTDHRSVDLSIYPFTDDRASLIIQWSGSIYWFNKHACPFEKCSSCWSLFV